MSFPRPSFLLALWAMRVRGTPFLLICLQNYEKIIKRKPAFPLFFQNESLFLRGRIIMQSFCICMPFAGSMFYGRRFGGWEVRRMHSSVQRGRPERAATHSPGQHPG